MPLLGGGKESREVHIRVGACHYVHAVVPDEFLLHAFGHAAYHADYEAASLAAFGAERLQAAHYLLFGIVAYRAGVEQHRVGIVDFVGDCISCHLHDCGYDFAVGHVHLAAVGFYI